MEKIEIVTLEEGIPTTSQLHRNQVLLAAKLNQIVDKLNHQVIGE